jgi:hypothetical protein
MLSLAICSNKKCNYILALEDLDRGTFIAPPECCPKCRCAIIVWCPLCRFPIVGLATERQEECKQCHADLRGPQV